MTETDSPPAARNRLQEVGRAAMRVALLEELERQGWNITHAGKALGLDRSNVLRALHWLGCEAELEAARASGKVKTGRPSKALRG